MRAALIKVTVVIKTNCQMNTNPLRAVQAGPSETWAHLNLAFQ